VAKVVERVEAFFGTKEVLNWSLQTRWMYANLQAIQAIRGFVKHQISNAPTINKPTSAPKVMATT
jgi:hypothetical protein